MTTPPQMSPRTPARGAAGLRTPACGRPRPSLPVAGWASGQACGRLRCTHEIAPEPCALSLLPPPPTPFTPSVRAPYVCCALGTPGSSSTSTPPLSEDFAWWPSVSFWSALLSSSSPQPRPRSSCPLASLGTHPCLPPGGLRVRARFAFPSSHQRGPLSPGPRLVPPYDSVCPVPDAPVHATGAAAAPVPPVPLQTSPCAVTSYTRPALISAGFSFVCVPSGGPSALPPLCPPLPSLPLTALVGNLAASALPSP